MMLPDELDAEMRLDADASMETAQQNEAEILLQKLLAAGVVYEQPVSTEKLGAET